MNHSSDDESKLFLPLHQGAMMQQLNILFGNRKTVTPDEVFDFYQNHIVPNMFNYAVVEEYNAYPEEFELYTGPGLNYHSIEHLNKEDVSLILTQVINSPERRRKGSRDAFARLNRMPGAPIRRGVPSLQLLARYALPTSQQADVNAMPFPPPGKLYPNVKNGTGRRRKTKSCRKKSYRKKSYRKKNRK